MTDAARRIVLARRARFVSAALVGIAGCAPARGPGTHDPATHTDLVVPPLDGSPPVAPASPSAQEPTAYAALDSDGDGIPDVEDTCPLEAGAPSADPKDHGCPVAPPVALLACLSIVVPQWTKVHFAPRSATVSASESILVDEMARALSQDHTGPFTLEGHTDTTEPDALGQARADAVKRELVRRGVDPARITTANAGRTRPFDDNRTEGGRAQNRRVEVRVGF